MISPDNNITEIEYYDSSVCSVVKTTVDNSFANIVVADLRANRIVRISCQVDSRFYPFEYNVIGMSINQLAGNGSVESTYDFQSVGEWSLVLDIRRHDIMDDRIEEALEHVTAWSSCVVTRYGYDSGLRPNKIIDAKRNVTVVEYDSFGIPIETGRENRIGEYARLTRSESDPAGDGLVLKTTAYVGPVDYRLTAPDRDDVDGNANRVVESHYDWRGRLVATITGSEDEFSPNRVVNYLTYDNLGRLTSESIFSGGEGIWPVYIDRIVEHGGVNDSGVPYAPHVMQLRSKTTNAYDNLGRIYRTSTHGIQEAGYDVAGTLDKEYWYDARGNVAMQLDLATQYSVPDVRAIVGPATKFNMTAPVELYVSQ